MKKTGTSGWEAGAAHKGDRDMASNGTRDKTFSQSVNWVTTFFMVAFHIGAVAALFYISWKPILVAFVRLWVAGSLGIGMRLITGCSRIAVTKLPSGWNIS